MQPTATRSPGLNLVTAEPVLVTRPTISCQGTHGKSESLMNDADFLERVPATLSIT